MPVSPASVGIAVSVTLLMLVLLGLVAAGLWYGLTARRRPVEEVVVHLAERGEAAKGDEEVDRWVHNDDHTHALSFDRNRPHSSMNTADSYVCVCTQDTCSGVPGSQGQRVVGVTEVENYGDGWVCADEVFGTRRQPVMEDGPSWPRRRPPAELQAVEGGGPQRPTKSSYWSEDDE